MAGKCSGMDISEVCESQGATVHGMVVGELSPVKDSRGKAGVRYFEGQLSDGKKTVRMVSFEPKLRSDLDRLRKSGEGVALVNCCIKRSKMSGGETLEIVAGCRSSVKPSPKKFRVDDAAVLNVSGVVEVKCLEEVKYLAVNQHVSVSGKVVSIEAAEMVHVKARSVTLKKEAFVLADGTGVIRGVAWEKDAGVVKVGCSYKFCNVTVRSFGGAKYLSLSENSAIEEVEDIGEVVEEDADDPVGVKIVKGEIVHVEKCDTYDSCRTCRAKVIAINETIGKCSKCEAKVKMSKSYRSRTARFVVKDCNGHEYKVTAFDEVVEKIVDGLDGEEIEDKLLCAPEMTFTLNNKDVVCAVNTAM